MSSENVDLARLLFEAHRAREVDAFAALCHPDLETHALIARLEGLEFRGPVAYREFRAFIDATWEALVPELEHVSEIDEERVMSTIHVRARSRGSGVPIDQRVVWLMTMRQGKLARVEVHSSEPEALESAKRTRSERSG